MMNSECLAEGAEHLTPNFLVGQRYWHILYFMGFTFFRNGYNAPPEVADDSQGEIFLGFIDRRRKEENLSKKFQKSGGF